jgi:phage regulator Rha-like protein
LRLRTNVQMPQKSRVQAALVHVGGIQQRIYLIRDRKVMLDSDLATLYGVATKALNQAVKRNSSRFPLDFAFQLRLKEADLLRSQFVTSNDGRGGRRYLPYVFTEHGVAMLSSVLNSERAVQMNILIVRAFIKLRDMLAKKRKIAVRVEKLEANQQRHASAIGVLAEEIDQLKRLPAPEVPKRRIGFPTAGKDQGAKAARHFVMVSTAKSA